MLTEVASRIVLFLALVAAAGCAHVASPPEPPPAKEVPVEALRAEAVVRFDHEKSAKGRALIVVKRPDKFRIEVSGPLGSTAAVLISDGSRLYLYSEGRLRSYPVGKQGAGLPYSFGPAELVSFLLGTVPGEGTYLRKTDGSGLSALVKLVKGKPAVKVTLEERRNVDGASLPFEITVEDSERFLSVRYTRVEVNPEIGPRAFEAPSGR